MVWCGVVYPMGLWSEGFADIRCLCIVNIILGMEWNVQHFINPRYYSEICTFNGEDKTMSLRRKSCEGTHTCEKLIACLSHRF